MGSGVSVFSPNNKTFIAHNFATDYLQKVTHDRIEIQSNSDSADPGIVINEEQNEIVNGECFEEEMVAFANDNENSADFTISAMLLLPEHDSSDEDDNLTLTNNNLKEIISTWDTTLSSVFLEFSTSGKTVKHSNLLGNFPSALCESSAPLSCVTFLIDYAPRRDNYISFGVAAYDRIPSAEIGECFGKLPFTWGIIDRRNNLQPSEIWFEGNMVRRARSLQEEDEISFVLDLREEIGNCKIYLNKLLLYTFGPIDSSQRYVLGSTVCPAHTVLIVPRDAFSFDVPTDDWSEDALRSEDDPYNADVAAQLFGQSSASTSMRSTATTIRSTNGVALTRERDDLIPVLLQSQSEPQLASQPQPHSQSQSTLQPPVPEIFPREMRLLDRGTNSSKKMKPRPENRCVDLSEANSSDSKLCCICLENLKCVVLMPCKHLCVCEVCGADDKRATQQLKSCPICRETIKQRIQVFM